MHKFEHILLAKANKKRTGSPVLSAFHCESLLCVIDHAAFANQVDLDLTRIVHFVFDLLGDLSCHQYHLLIVDDLRYHHDTNLTASLQCVALFYALIRRTDAFQLL